MVKADRVRWISTLIQWSKCMDTQNCTTNNLQMKNVMCEWNLCSWQASWNIHQSQHITNRMFNAVKSSRAHFAVERFGMLTSHRSMRGRREKNLVDAHKSLLESAWYLPVSLNWNRGYLLSVDYDTWLEHTALMIDHFSSSGTEIEPLQTGKSLCVTNNAFYLLLSPCSP